MPIIKQYCTEHQLSMDNEASPANVLPPPPKTMTPSLALALQLFRDGSAIEDVMHQTGRARPTVMDYLSK